MTKRKSLQSDLHAEWRASSACRPLEHTDPGLFAAFVDERHHRAVEAAWVCRRKCEVRVQCLVDAALDSQAQGLRAGYYFDNGGVKPEDQKTARRRDHIRLRSRKNQKPETEE